MTADPAAGAPWHVIDASALLRLHLGDGPLPANLETVMERGCRGDGLLLIPDLCWLEMASVLRKQITRQLLSPEEAAELLADLQRLPLRTQATADLCATCLELSQSEGISVYDACYLALALRHGATLITADVQLAAAARRRGCASADGG